MSDDSDFLDKLAQSIADGGSINWEEIDKLPADAELRRLLGLFRIVADVAEVHRSPVADVSSPADHISTKPAAEHAAPQQGGVHDSTGGLGQWGHLQLLRKIGEGAFGEVYHAHDTWLDHPVALKLFKPKVASRAPSNRILHEARKLARVRHPNVVSVHGADSHDGRVGFWMDLIEGETLADLVVAGRLSAGEATFIGQEVCRALAAVHHAEIVHRDVKAQNVMRASDGGRIILMDFGAGEFIKDKSASSRGQGTPLYLAPEIFAGEDASVQSDIYSVGVLLYYLVSGTFPVRASSVPDLVDAHRRGARQRLRDKRPDLPNSFVSTVERAINPDPAQRFASAGEMEAALTGGTTPSVGPLGVERRETTKERTVLQRVEFIGLVAAIAFVVTEALGVIATRAFEVALGIEPDFAAGPIEYFPIGAYALIPFIIFWLVGAALLGALSGLRPLLRAPLDAGRKRWKAMTSGLDPEALATIIFLCGAGCWIAIGWKSWGFFEALEALRRDPAAKPVDLSVLSSASSTQHSTYGLYSAYLSFFLGLAAWRWFPRLERHADDGSRVRLLKWATVAVAFLVIATNAVPRRFIWEKFEVVSFDNQTAFVIGQNNEELLLYAPEGEARKRWRVRKDAANLQRTGTTAVIFDPQ